MIPFFCFFSGPDDITIDQVYVFTSLYLAQVIRSAKSSKGLTKSATFLKNLGHFMQIHDKNRHRGMYTLVHIFCKLMFLTDLTY